MALGVANSPVFGGAPPSSLSWLTAYFASAGWLWYGERSVYSAGVLQPCESLTRDGGTTRITTLTPIVGCTAVEIDAAKMPTDADSGSESDPGRHVVDFGAAVSTRRRLSFTVPRPQGTDDTIYAVFDKPAGLGMYGCLLQASNAVSPYLYVSGLDASKAIVWINPSDRCATACPAGRRILRSRISSGRITMRIDSAETGLDITVTRSNWTTLSRAMVDESLGCILHALAIGPTPSTADDLRIRQILATLTGATWPIS